MKIKLSKSQWEGIGKTAGWMKEAGLTQPGSAEVHGERYMCHVSTMRQ